MDHVIAFLKTQLENQFLSGGAILVVFTAVLAYSRVLPSRLFDLFERFFITRVDVSDHDPAFYWIQTWLGAQAHIQTKTRLLTLTTRKQPVKHDSAYDDKKPSVEIVLSPAPGYHLLRFKNSFILLYRARTESANISGTVAYHETFTLQTFSREHVRELVLAARELFFPPEDKRVAVYKLGYSEWRMTMKRLPRSLASVILAGDTQEVLLKDLQWFFSASNWYSSLGIPYQRGYLFYGPGGTGKTSITVALAGHFERDIYVLNLAQVSDNVLMGLMAELPEHAIVLIEDLDSAFVARKSEVDQLTFSGFLNAIDGVAAAVGRVLIMTTNHPDKLDPVLIRPGRTDLILQFGNADADMAKRLFLRFFPEKEELAKMFGANIVPGIISMAELQEHLIKYRGDAVAAVDNVGRLVPAKTN